MNTPPPWKHTKASGKHRGAVWIKAGSVFVGKTYSHEGENAVDNAEFICRTVNSYELLSEIALHAQGSSHFMNQVCPASMADKLDEWVKGVNS